MARAGGGRGGPTPAEERQVARSGPELIVLMRDDAMVRTRGGDVAEAAPGMADALTTALAGAALRPLFGASEERIALASSAVPGAPDLSVFYRVEAPEAELADLARRLTEADAVSAAYVKPGAEPPLGPTVPDEMVPLADAPPVSPDFSARQFYLEAAPGGVDARHAWNRAGGKGTGVRVIDVEGAWRFDHEDLLQNQGGVVGGTPSTQLAWRDHGTAVVGVIGSDENTFGTVGIAPSASTSAISIFGPGQSSAKAIRDAADRLSPGDIILIELHRPGPRHGFQARDDQAGYIAVEWWEDDFAAVRYATAKGVIVVEAAGNGAENLDDPLYSVRPAGFPASWTNPFHRANRDSGAVLVGAGAPPPGTHGRNHGPDRSRLDFSNYGAALDVQGIGREVTTTGYGDLQGGDEKVWYTDRFSGTSSSSPIVVAVLACAQGALRAAARPALTPATARDLLRTTGSPQQDAPGRPATQRIGRRPDLREVFGRLFPKQFKENKELKEKDLKDVKDIKDHKEKEKDKEKEFKEIKEIKEIKEHKEFKEKEFKEFKEKDFENPAGLVGQPGDVVQGARPVGDLEARIAGLEAAIADLTHFIAPDLRPDVT